MNNNTKIDLITEKMKEVLDILGVTVNASTEGTPRRIAKMYVNEVFKNLSENSIEELDKRMTYFPNPNKKTESSSMVILKDIPFFSMCEHHFMPFSGKITVAYVPNDKIIGLSKIPRVVKHFSKKPQLQERLVKEIGDYLFDRLGKPSAVFVWANDCVHTCVSARGIETYCETDTLYKVGYKANEYMEEFLRRAGV